MSPAEIVARSTSARGETVLRRHHDGVVELRVNGVFVMDDREVRSEEMLAAIALQARPERVLVGGLGLGYTVRTLLRDEAVRHLLVAEIEPCLVEWMRAGLIPSVLDDPRVEIRTGDVRELVARTAEASLDAVVLDVDNGPDFLVYAANAELYRHGFLAECGRALRPGGALTVWSSTRSASLEAEIRAVFDDCRVLPVALPSRSGPYYVYGGTGPHGAAPESSYADRHG